jgi:hypothetical protein
MHSDARSAAAGGSAMELTSPRNWGPGSIAARRGAGYGVAVLESQWERLLRRWWARVALLGCSISLATAVALALPAGASASTRGFHVYNLSGYTLRLVSTTGDFYYRHDDGDLLEPGSYQDFEVTFYYFSDNDTTAHYDIIDGSDNVVGQFTVDMDVGAGNNFGPLSSSCSVQSSGTSFGPCQAGMAGNPETINFLDPPGTVHDIPAGQGQDQADVLKQLCNADADATCKFSPTSETQVDSPTHQVGDALVNNTDEDQDTSIATTDTLQESNSLSISASAETDIFETVKVKVTAAYGHVWTTSHTFTQTVDVHCPAHNRCSISATEPMLRDTGDFTLTTGNTTWQLRDVYFDTPDPDGNGAYIVNSQPLSPNEQATLPATFQSETHATVKYSLPAKVTDSPTADAKLGVTITGPSSAAAGHADSVTAAQADSDRIVLTSTQPVGRLVYPLDDVQVRAQVDGHDQRHWTVSSLPLDHHVTLPPFRYVAPSIGGRACVTVIVTAKHAIGAHARECTTAR